MCWFGKRPALSHIGTKANDKHALSLLRNTVIRRVQDAENDTIMKICTVGTARVMPFKPIRVFMPILVLARPKIGVGKLKDYVFEEICECLANQASHILEYEGARPNLTHGTNCLRKKISSVVAPLMLSGDGKRLTWRSPRDEVHALPLSKVDGMHVDLEKRPVRCGCDSLPLISTDCLACIVIVFDYADVLQTGCRATESQSTCASK